jgi:glycosyltransferase EpsE
MHKTPLVSILISTYNDEISVVNAVRSVQNQTYKNLEIIVLDDGSTDDTYKLVKSITDNDSRVKLLKNEENIGLTKSLNILIKESTGEIIARQDADDISLPQRIRTQINFIQKYKLDFCSSRAVTMKSNRKIPSLSFYLPKKFIIKLKNPFIHGTLMIKKDVLLKVGNYDENYYYSQDYKLMIKLINEGFKFKVLKKPLYVLNTENNISTLNSSEQQKYANDAKRGK